MIEFFKTKKLLPSRKIKREGVLIKIVSKKTPFWAYIRPEGGKIELGVCDYHVIAPNQEKVALEWASENAGFYASVFDLPAELREIIRRGFSVGNLSKINVGKKAREWFIFLAEGLKKIN